MNPPFLPGDHADPPVGLPVPGNIRRSSASRLLFSTMTISQFGSRWSSPGWNPGTPQVVHMVHVGDHDADQRLALDLILDPVGGGNRVESITVPFRPTRSRCSASAALPRPRYRAWRRYPPPRTGDGPASNTGPWGYGRSSPPFPSAAGSGHSPGSPQTGSGSRPRPSPAVPG